MSWGPFEPQVLTCQLPSSKTVIVNKRRFGSSVRVEVPRAPLLFYLVYKYNQCPHPPAPPCAPLILPPHSKICGRWGGVPVVGKPRSWTIHLLENQTAPNNSSYRLTAVRFYFRIKTDFCSRFLWLSRCIKAIHIFVWTLSMSTRTVTSVYQRFINTRLLPARRRPTLPWTLVPPPTLWKSSIEGLPLPFSFFFFSFFFWTLTNLFAFFSTTNYHNNRNTCD